MRRSNKTSGLTLIELMVALAVLAMMILVVNALMVSVVQTVKESQEIMKITADGRAAAQMIRSDMRNLTRDSYLTIVAGTPGAGTYTAGPIASGWSTHDTLSFVAIRQIAGEAWIASSGAPWSCYPANAMRVEYGMCRLAQGENVTKNYSGEIGMFRRTTAVGTMDDNSYWTDALYFYIKSPIAAYNLWNRDVATLCFTSLYRINTSDYQAPGIIIPPGEVNGKYWSNNGTLPVTYPISSPAKVWFGQDKQFLIGPCGTMAPMKALQSCLLTVQWTDGTRDAGGNLNWYGRTQNPSSYASTFKVKDSGWTGRSASYQTQNPQQDVPEFRLPLDTAYGGSAYCALWTNHKRDNWPKALKLSYGVGMGDRRQVFEVVVDLGN